MAVIFLQPSFDSQAPPFCPVNNDRQFENMVGSVWNANITRGSFCSSSTNITLHYQDYEVGECRIECNHKDWLGVQVRCPFSLTGLEYGMKNNTHYASCRKGNFTMTFFAKLGNLVDVSTILVLEKRSHTIDEYTINDENHGTVNWLTYAARKGALTTVKKIRKVWREFQFVDDNEDINIEKPGQFCSVNPICHH